MDFDLLSFLVHFHFITQFHIAYEYNTNAAATSMAQTNKNYAVVFLYCKLI